MTRMWLVAKIYRSWRVYCRRDGNAAVGPMLAQLRTGKGIGGVQVAFAANFAAFIAFAVRGACPLLQ